MNADLCQVLLQLVGDSKTKEQEVLRKYIKKEELSENEKNVSFGIYSIDQMMNVLEKIKEKEIEKRRKQVEELLKEKGIPSIFYSSIEEAWKSGTKKAIKQTLEVLVEVEEFQDEERLKEIIKEEKDLNKLEHWNHHVISILAEIRNKEKVSFLEKYSNKNVTASEKEEKLRTYVKNVGEDEWIASLTFMKRKKEND